MTEHLTGDEVDSGDEVEHGLERLNELLGASGASASDQCLIAYLLGGASVARMRGAPKGARLDPVLLRAVAVGSMSEAHAREIDALADRLIEIARGVIS